MTGQMTMQAGTNCTPSIKVSDGAQTVTSSGGTVTVAQEDASIAYSGDATALVGSTLNLRATVMDSAATGYSGANPETGTSATIGDITKMWVEFDIYTESGCLTSTPTKVVYAQVADTGTSGDGIGTASAMYTSSSEASYCVVAKVVGGNTGGTNLYYTAPDAQTAVFTFYNNTGQFVTGGGWILDPAGGGNGHGNFGFNARFNKNNSPQGQMVYVYRGTYNGVAADYVIKSNSLTGLGFSCWNSNLVPPAYAACPAGNTTFPAKGTLQGKATIQINKASDGTSLYSDGNATFTAAVVDSGKSSGIGVDYFSLLVYDKNTVLYKQVSNPNGLSTVEWPGIVLQGGNVVIHGTTK
jgi:hypothetical protein